MSLARSVIILNGPPHAGKSTIINKTQVTADKPYYSLGIDQLFNFIEPQLVIKELNKKRSR